MQSNVDYLHQRTHWHMRQEILNKTLDGMYFLPREFKFQNSIKKEEKKKNKCSFCTQVRFFFCSSLNLTPEIWQDQKVTLTCCWIFVWVFTGYSSNGLLIIHLVRQLYLYLFIHWMLRVQESNNRYAVI